MDPESFIKRLGDYLAAPNIPALLHKVAEIRAIRKAYGIQFGGHS